MKKIIFALVVAVVTSVALSGCGGVKVEGVPGTVAVVNGESISANKYFDIMNRRSGREVLNALIEQSIMIQWAEAEGVAPTDAQVEEQIKAMKRDGSYDDQIELLGEELTKDDLRALQARINLSKKFYKISDQDVQAAYDMMKQRYVHGPKKQIMVVLNSDRKRLEEAEKAIKEGREFKDVAVEFSDPRISARGPIKLWVDESEPKSVPPPVMEALKKTKLNEVSKIFSIGQSGQPMQFAMIKVVKTLPKLNLKKEDVKGELESAATLQKAMADVEFQKKFNARKRQAEIEINVDQYKDLIWNFKNVPDPLPPMGMPSGKPGQPAPAPQRKR